MELVLIDEKLELYANVYDSISKLYDWRIGPNAQNFSLPTMPWMKVVRFLEKKSIHVILRSSKIPQITHQPDNFSLSSPSNS